jgi:multidrug efflux system membrane fusion protein
MPVTVKVVGAVEAISTVQIHAQVTGQLSEITFREGQDVQKGQPLFNLDPRPFDVALKQAEAVLAKDTAQANNAEATRARSEDLFNRGLVPRNDYEALAATSAALKASVDADAAAVEAARLNLQYTRITAPAAGRTGALLVHVGDLIRANDTAPMVVINQVAPIYVTASVPGNILDDIQRHHALSPLRLEAKTAESSEPPAVGKLTFVDNSVDSTTGSIKIKGEFANTDGALWPGSFVNVVLRLSVDPHAIVTPSAAVQQSQQGSYVYVVGQDETVEMRPITVARTEGGESVVADGLRAGERVVVDGQLRLTPGAHITEQTTRADTGATR